MAAGKSGRLRPSRTAELVAAARHHHRIKFSPPIFDDRYAYSMCGPFWRTVLSSRLLTKIVVGGLLRNVNPIIPAIVTRARFAEDCVELAVQNEIEQYVIIGAGYDTLSFRRPDLMSKLKVYELDRKPTQELKLRRMKAAGFTKHRNVHFIEADLEFTTLLDALEPAGFDASQRTLFSWFGVTYYLTPGSVRATLKCIADDMASGSWVVFDYLADEEWVPQSAKQLRKKCANFVARRGEPWLTSYSPPALPDMLRELGFSSVQNMQPDEFSKEYEYPDPEFTYPPIIGMCRADTAGSNRHPFYGKDELLS